ncbi:MAG: GLUG motif-containing protein [Candidatus Izemoplasmatales bacterium]
MKKLMTLLMVVSVFFLAGCNFLGEEETENTTVDYTNFIKVSTADELMEMDVHKSYELDQDIDLNGQEWTPIGTFNMPFRGHFNGNGYTISNFKITENHLGYNGLFGYVEGDIENLNVIDFDINISSDFLVNVGGLVGSTYGSVTNVYVDGHIEVNSPEGNVYAGLLVGNALTSLQKLVISNEFKPNHISDNQASGQIIINESELTYVGGLIGKAHNIAIIDNKVLDANIQINSDMSTYSGGVVGHYFLYDLENTDSSLYVDKDIVYRNIAKVDFHVTSMTHVSLGGFAGYSQNVNIYNNFVLSQIYVSASDYHLGLLVGENWAYDIGNNLSIVESITISDDQGSYASIIGKNRTETKEINGFYASYITSDFISQGSEVNISDLNQVSFYENHFTELDSAFIEMVIQLLFTE